MKKILFYIVHNSTDDPNKIFWQENKNSLFSYDDKKIIFNSQLKNPKIIDVKFANVIFDKKLSDDLIDIAEAAKNESQLISNELIGIEKDNGSIDGAIASTIQKFSYETPNSIFYFIGDFFIKLLMGHKLINGNKRFALLFLIGSLRYFGYHFNWSKGIHKNYSSYKTEIEKIVEKLEKGYNEHIKNEIADWIKRKSTITLEWR